MKAILPFFRLIRILNVLILILVEVILYFGYIAYYADRAHVELALSPTEFWIFITITALLIVGGNIINDIMDVDIDTINRPDKRIVDQVISSKAAWRLYHTTNILALILTTYWYYTTQNRSIAITLLLTALGLYYYSSWMKRKFLIGNLIIAIICALPPLWILFIEFSTISSISESYPQIGLWIVSIIGVYSYFAFATTMYRELIKDIQDIPGDKAVGCTTLPVLAGGFIAKRVALVMAIMLSFSIIAWLIYQWPMGSLVNQVAIVIGLILPLGISIIRLHRGKSVQDFRSVSKAIKLLMFNGIIYLLIVKTLIPAI